LKEALTRKPIANYYLNNLTNNFWPENPLIRVDNQNIKKGTKKHTR